jgi:erythromycin esterase
MKRYADDVAALAIPVDGPGDLGALLARVGDASIVMLGEAATARTSSTAAGRTSPDG